ncbi:hypothetical protein MNBD_GAMMA04-249 [hydrothermal vent metagenome]|uniref:Lipoprotein n=1 Tax=hydrothermal vent metagenome TaxID=652676 RepID=A0A3B0W0J4_9ZZZZ
MKNHIPVLFSVGLTIVLAGCSSSKDASKDNFKKVINEYLDRNCIMISTHNNKFPATINLDNVWMADKIEQYNALASIGMFEVKDGSAQKNKSAFSTEKITVPTKIYSLSEKGKDAFTKNTLGTNQGFCVATYKVNEVNSFSEPSQAIGYIISNVNFTASPQKIKDWATNGDIIKAFPRLAKRLEENQEKSATLFLMNDGWMHEKEMKK